MNLTKHDEAEFRIWLQRKKEQLEDLLGRDDLINSSGDSKDAARLMRKFLSKKRKKYGDNDDVVGSDGSPSTADASAAAAAVTVEGAEGKGLKMKKRKSNEEEQDENRKIKTKKNKQKHDRDDDAQQQQQQQQQQSNHSTSMSEEVQKDDDTKQPPNEKGNVSIMLFYAYCPVPMTREKQDEAIQHCYQTLKELGMTGRLRIAREGFNATLTGNYETVRQFGESLRKFLPDTFGETDFKFVDYLPSNQQLKGLKVWPVTEIVTYGFDAQSAPLENRGTHLSPEEFHNAMMDPNTVVIDVRNYNETAIGRFAPQEVLQHHSNDQEKKGATYLNPNMRRSTEFPEWVNKHHDELKSKRVLMYCTAGVRCERASAFLKNQGINDVYQLHGGIHRYLDAFPEDGGFWIGKNYTFDKRFAHGAKQAQVVSHCVYCEKPWERYQAHKKCCRCSMEVLLCKDCDRIKPSIPRYKLICPLCRPSNNI